MNHHLTSNTNCYAPVIKAMRPSTMLGSLPPFSFIDLLNFSIFSMPGVTLERFPVKTSKEIRI